MSDGAQIRATDVKAVVLPLIVYACVGLGSAYIGGQTLATQQVYTERRLEKIEKALDVVIDNRIVLAERAAWMSSTDRRMAAAEQNLRAIQRELRR